MVSPIADGARPANLESTRLAATEPPGRPGRVRLAFCRSGVKTVLAKAFAASPARLLAPRNHGDAAWVFLASLGGGLLDGDVLDVRIDVASGASALLGTQSSTKIYRSPRGCSQRIEAEVSPDAALVLVPDPVVCFAGARYSQKTRIALAQRSSLVLLDGYTCGRSARGERWRFDEYTSKTTVFQGGARLVVDATRLDATAGPIAARMGHFDVVLSLLAVGPRFAAVRAAALLSGDAPAASSRVVAASPIANDAVIVRVAADRFETASKALRPSFAALADVLGDDPFARKW